jgi:hypothetical protein
VKAPRVFDTVAESSSQCLGPFIVVPGYQCFAGPRERDSDVPVGVRGSFGDGIVQVEDSSDHRPIGAWWDASDAERAAEPMAGGVEPQDRQAWAEADVLGQNLCPPDTQLSGSPDWNIRAEDRQHAGRLASTADVPSRYPQLPDGEAERLRAENVQRQQNPQARGRWPSVLVSEGWDVPRHL